MTIENLRFKFTENSNVIRHIGFSNRSIGMTVYKSNDNTSVYRAISTELFGNVISVDITNIIDILSVKYYLIDPIGCAVFRVYN